MATKENIPIRLLAGIVIIIGIASFLLNCSKPQERQPTPGLPGKQAELAGTIRVSGAWALYPMMVRWGEEFQKLHPRVKVDISAGGAGKGVSDALGGLVDIGMVSRDIRPEEIGKGAFFVPVVKDAVFPAMNAQNPLFAESISKTGLKRQTFLDLWIEGKTLTWGEVSGTNSKDKVNVYTRSDSCGAAETWAKYLGKAQEDLKGTAVYGDPGIAEAVAKDILGIGFNNLNFAYDMKTGLPLQGIQVIPIDINENGIVDPEESLDTKEEAIKAVVSGVYPSPPARDLYLLTKGEFKGVTREFVKWILTDGQKYVDEVGYIQLKESVIKEDIAKIGD